MMSRMKSRPASATSASAAVILGAPRRLLARGAYVANPSRAAKGGAAQRRGLGKLARRQERRADRADGALLGLLGRGRGRRGLRRRRRLRRLGRAFLARVLFRLF